ncbi:MAG TPA: cell wall-binding repeat-containing protein [Euzebya sp.]|nr:cell wall-binding repeat-containing protein [Euzebya sp.]
MSRALTRLPALLLSLLLAVATLGLAAGDADATPRGRDDVTVNPVCSEEGYALFHLESDSQEELHYGTTQEGPAAPVGALQAKNGNRFEAWVAVTPASAPLYVTDGEGTVVGHSPAVTGGGNPQNRSSCIPPATTFTLTPSCLGSFDWQLTAHNEGGGGTIRDGALYFLDGTTKAFITGLHGNASSVLLQGLTDAVATVFETGTGLPIAQSDAVTFCVVDDGGDQEQPCVEDCEPPCVEDCGGEGDCVVDCGGEGDCGEDCGGDTPVKTTPTDTTPTNTTPTNSSGPSLPPAEEPTDEELPPAAEPGVDLIRIGGIDRIETAILISQDLFEDGAAAAVVLARADVPADAIAATPFSVASNAPVLLTDPASLDPRVADEIDRVLVDGGTVYIAGGEAAISVDVAQAVQALGATVERIAGTNRFGTATQLADRLYGLGQYSSTYSQTAGTTVLLADGGSFAAATVAGPAATALRGAVLLTSGAHMAPETAAWLAAHPVFQAVAVGAEAIAAAPDAEAIGDADPHTTAVALADRFFPAPTTVGVATSAAFPDPLTGGVDIAHRGGPLLLSPSDQLPAAVGGWVSANRSTLTGIRIYGGVGALSQDVASALAGATGQ